MDKAVLAVISEEKNNPDILKKARDKLSGIFFESRQADSGAGTKANGTSGGLKRFEVQYNPAALQFSGSGGIVCPGDGKNPETAAAFTQHTVVSQVSLSFELCFEGADVQEKIDGLLGMKLDKTDPVVLFCWGANSFTGSLTEMSAEYSMFEADGTPIRGKVNMTLTKEALGFMTENDRLET